MSAKYLNEIVGGWTAAGKQREPARRRVLEAGVRVLGTLRLWVRRMRQRSELRGVLVYEPRFFQDIGVSRATVYREAGKWFWQA
jgi:uncharacterized protein YjiS (DUF1127 family)